MTPTGFDANRLNVDKNRFRSINDVDADDDDIPMDQLSLDRSNDTTWFFLTDFLKGFRDPQVESAWTKREVLKKIPLKKFGPKRLHKFLS